ncbi:MAG TPA: late competence development ComFB family protein [Clostridiales bacterium]|nr:late competence development ComFB family protein [Clostridiales bacterium]
MAKTNKDYDKEYMYKKIMPSAFLEKDQAPNTSTPATETKAAPTIKVETETRKQNQPLGAKIPVSFDSINNTVLVNIMEHVVASKINDVFSRMNCCKCDRCKKDAAAIALNTLPAKYMVCEPDQINIIASSINDREATAAILKAVLTVRKNPRH